MHRSAWRILAFVVGLAFSSWAVAYGVTGKVGSTKWCAGDFCGESPATAHTAYSAASFAVYKSGDLSGFTWSMYGSPNCVMQEATKYLCKGIIFKYTKTDAYGSPVGSTIENGQYYDARTGSFCPNNSTEKAGQCECNLGFKPGAQNSCEALNCPTGGAYSKVTQPDMAVGGVGNVCMGGCEAAPSAYKADSSGQIYAEWPFRYSGKTCGGSPDTGGIDQTGDKGWQEKPTSCGSGKCPGTFNGQSMCVACSGGSTVDGGKTTAPGPVAPDQPGVDGVKGAETKEVSTSCTGSGCTTTTTYKDGTGTVVGTKTEEKPKENFCQENPGLSICKVGRFGGACAGASGAFSCDGDAVQCAIAQEQHRRGCEWSYVDPALQQAGEQAMNGQAQPDGHPFKNPEETALSFASQIDQTNRIAGGCPTDDVITVGSATVTIPWSRACGSLQMLGNIVVAFALLAAASIVFRS